MKRLIITFLFITHSLFGQSNIQTGINKNGLLSIVPKNHLDPEQLNQNSINGNSSSVFWVEPKIRDNYEPPALPIIERSNNDWCGTMPWWEERNSGQRSCDYHGITDDPTIRDTYIPNANTETIIFRLFIHAFADDNGNNPTTTLADAEAQLLSLNDIFSSNNIQFYAWFQIHNDSQFQSLTSAQWSSGEIKETYAMDPTIYHNAYVADSDADWGILGVSTFPWDSEALTVYGGTFIDKDWFGGPRSFSGTADVPNHTATHEFGHALGLWHTHHGVDEVDVCSSCYEGADGYTYATGDSADVVGDLCSDTKATPTNFTCADPDTFDCQGNSWVNTDVHNFMGYADDDCYNLNNDGFSSQQSGRMHGWITDRYEGIIVNSEEMALLSVGFETGLPNDWTVIDDDGDGSQWGFYYDDADFDMSHYGAAGGAVYNNSATNSDYLITPFIDIPSNVATATFSFWAKSHSSSYPEDFVARISTDGTNFTSLGSTTSASSDWTQYSYDISSYIGQSVYLALHCVSTYGWYLMADDFLVSASLNALPLDAEFSASLTTGTAPTTIDFTDISAGSPTSWSWTFGDGGTSILQNPTHTFQYAGLYTVSLVVSDGTDSSTETKTGYINIAEPGADTLLTESFETTLPSDWTVIDNDADGNQWSRYNNDGHDGSISMGVQWNSAGNDDWLITPQLSLTANSSISFSFWARSLSSSYLEDFNVKLATASNSISDFTTIIGSVVSTPYGWTEYEYDLSEYSGQSIYLAVQCVSVGQYYLFVDDFELVCDPILPDLFFSEYIEGSSNNKALEIFNPRDTTIDLANYRIAWTVNGNGWQYWHTFPSGSSIADGDVWVMLNSSASSDYYDVSNADEVLDFPSVVQHNGDDARGLEKTTDSGTTWTLIDIIGDPDNDPGSGWDVAGVTNATKNHTLVRKVSVASGNTEWSASAGTTTGNSEWIVYDQNYFANLGFHISPYSAEHIIITNDTLVVLEDSSSTIDLLDNDLIVGITSFTLAIVDSADNGTIALVGHTALSYSPNANFFGNDTVSYRVFSSEAADTGLVFITVNAVNDAPVASAGTVTTNEDTEYSGILSASDVDGDALTYSVLTSPVNGTIAITSSSSGTYTYTPTANYNGSDSLTFTASDGTLLDTAKVSITVTAVDDIPIASNDTVTTNEDTDYSGTLIASDGDGDALTYSIIDSTVNGTVTLSDPAAGTFTYSPLANFNGSDSLLFSASDGILLDTGSVTIVVTTIDDLPVVANPLPDITVNEDASDTTLGDLKNVFLDVDEELIYSHVVNDTGLVFVSVTNDTVTLQFLTDANGSTEIVFTATNPTTRASVSDTALITVLPMNDAPEIVSSIPDTSMVEDETLSLLIQFYDMDGDSLTIYGGSDTGAVNVNWDGELITMTSVVDWNGSAGITVIVIDDSSAGDTANFTLTIEPANDPPEEFSVIYPTVSDTFSTHADNDTLIQFTWGKSNDIDSDVTYNLTIELEFFGNTYTDIHENISDTTISVSSNSLDPMLNVISEEEAGFTYYVHASDDEYNVASDVGEFVLSRAALGSIDGYAIPEQFSLHQNYPNPFNPVTTLRYDLPENGHVNITIYDMLGREVKTLINQTQDAGYRSIIWNATNDYGKPVSAGIYLYQIQASEYISTKKMVLLK